MGVVLRIEIVYSGAEVGIVEVLMMFSILQGWKMMLDEKTMIVSSLTGELHTARWFFNNGLAIIVLFTYRIT